MKKLFLVFGLMVLPYTIYADTITNGLLIPTTGVISARSWADKYNANFVIIGSSLNMLVSSNTSTLNLLQATAAALSNYQNSVNSSTGAIVVLLQTTAAALTTYQNSLNATTGTFSTGGGGTASTGSLVVNLIITTNSTTSQLVVTADYLSIMGAMSINYSTTVDLAVVGPGGVDVSTGIPNTWYSIYAIAKGTTNVFGILASTIGSGTPALPTGYTAWRKIGNVRENPQSKVISYVKHGQQVSLWTSKNMVNSGSSLPTAPTLLDLSSVVSSNAVNTVLSVIIGDLSATIGNGVRVVIRPAGGGDVIFGNSYFGLYMVNATAKQWAGTVPITLFGTPQVTYNRGDSNDANADQLVIDVQAYMEDVP